MPKRSLGVLLACLTAFPAAAEKLGLADVLERARAGSPRVAAAGASHAAASARAAQAFGARLPSIDFAGVLHHDQPLDGPTPPTQPNYTAAISLSYPLFDFGRTRNRHEAARALESGAEAHAAAEVAAVELEALSAYYDLLSAQAQESLAKDTANELDRHRQRAEKLVEAGIRPEFDLLGFETRLEAAKLTVSRAGNVQAVARLRLATLLGVKSVEVDEQLFPEVPGEGGEPDALFAQSLERRPEIEALRRRALAGDASARAANDEFLPELSTTIQVAGAGDNSRWNPAPTASGQLVLTQPIWAGGRIAAGAREAEADAAFARAQLSLAERDLRVQLAEALSAIRDAKSTLQAMQVLAAKGERQLELAQKRYQQGAGSIFEITDAYATLSSARAQRAEATYTLSQARAALLRASGASLSEVAKRLKR